MRTLVGMLVVVVVSGVSGDDTVNVTGIVGGDSLLPCNCSNRNSTFEFKWQTEGKTPVRVVTDIGNTPNFSKNYTSRAKLFLSENRSNCSLLLRNISLEDKRKYKCIFKAGKKGQYTYFFVDLNVSGTASPSASGILAPSPEPTSPSNFRTLYRMSPVALVAVFSLFLLYKRKVSGRQNVGEEELRISV